MCSLGKLLTCVGSIDSAGDMKGMRVAVRFMFSGPSGSRYAGSVSAMSLMWLLPFLVKTLYGFMSRKLRESESGVMLSDL